MFENMDQPTENLWHEINSGVFQRSMTPLECFFNPVMGWSIWTSIQLGPIPNTSNSEEDIVDRVRRAWIQTLYEQPQLGSIFNFPKGTCTYTTTTETSLASWLRETFIVADNPYLVVATREKPFLCINPTTRELLFRTPHNYTDGIGATLLMADIVSHVANPQSTIFGNEAKNLPPVFEVAADMAAAETTDQERGMQLTNGFLENQPSVGLPFHDGPTVQHSVSQVCLSLEDSNSLVSACKVHGLTVTHAVHAALIQAVAEINPIADAKNYTSLHIYDWRARVQAKYQRCRTTMYCGAFPMSVLDPGTRDFGGISEELKRLYVGTRYDEDIARAQGSWWSGVNAALSGAGEVPPMSTPMMSSLGVVEKVLPKVISGVEVDNYKFGLDVNGPTVVVYLWNWDGKVNISAAWDRGAFEEEEVDGFLDRILQKLATPLSLAFSLK